MNLDKWKKKPSKKELFDIIKIQEEEISRLNKEKMNFNIVIRNEKPIRIDTQGLDYMVNLEQKYYDLQSTIKEAREYVENNSLYEQDYTYDYEENIEEWPPDDTKARKELLEILNKEKKWNI